MKPSMKKKIKTTVFWSSIVSAIILFVQNIAVIFGYEIPTETIAMILAAVNSFLAILVLSGVLVDSKEVDSYQSMRMKMKK